jgi:outer membrane protein assembly factor BamB
MVGANRRRVLIETLWIALLAFGVSEAYAQTPALEWSFDTGGKIYASPILADLEGDGTVEIIIAASRAQRLLCLDGRGAPRWDFRYDDGVTDGFQATPSVVDLDGDGRKEIVWVTRGGTLGCVDAAGRLQWRKQIGDQVDYTGPAAADLDGDGRVEMVFGSESGTLYCTDALGQVLWRYQGEGAVRGIPAVANVDGTAVLRCYAVFGGGLEACFDAEGNRLWAFDEARPAQKRWSAVAVGDLDGDGNLETVSATEDFFVIVRDARTGAERWRWKGQGPIDQTCSFALADFGKTGGLDILTGDFSGQVYRLHEGQAVWSVSVGGGVVQGPSVGDVDGDGRLEVLACCRDNRLVCLADSGEQKWDFKTQAAPLTTPALGDVDADGQVEIVFTAKDHLVRCISAGGAYNAENLPWPMLAHDPQLSNNIQGAVFNSLPPAAGIAVSVPLTVEAFGPFSMGENRIRYQFQNAAARSRHLEAVFEVTQPSGAVISQTLSSVCSPFETKSGHFPITVREVGGYALAARLTDLGAGRTLAEEGESCTVVAFAAETAMAEDMVQQGRAHIDRFADAGLRDRANRALLTAKSDMDEALDFAAAHPEAVDKAIGHVQGAMRGLREVTARLNAAAVTPGTPQAFAVVPASSLVKIFKDEPFEADPLNAFSVNLAQNEYEPLQVVVVPLWQDLKGLRVHTTALKQAAGGGAIPEAQVQVQRVGYVEIGPPEYNWPVEKLGWYPDVLFPADPVEVPAGQNAQPFFVTVKTAADTPPGEYSGELRIEAEGTPSVTVPLTVQVWAFALPEKTTLKTSFWMSEGDIRAFYGYPERVPFEVRKRFYDLHLEHRMSPVKDFPMRGGEMLEDFDYLMAHGQNCFFIPVPDKMPPERMQAYEEDLHATRTLLKEKGWDQDALFYSHDEVAVMAREKIPEVVEMNAWVKSLVPEWPRLETSAPELSLVGAVDVWCPTIDNFNPSLLAMRQAQGDRLWMYTVWGRPGIMIDFPAVDHRLMFWACWKYHAEGFLYWGTTHWQYNTQGEGRWPERPWITYNSQPGHNGCGYMVYPGPEGTPYPSVRMCLARDGIEDYEYFNLLRSLLEKHGQNVEAGLRSDVESALAVNPAVLADHRTFTENPQLLIQERSRLAALIETLAAR